MSRCLSSSGALVTKVVICSSRTKFSGGDAGYGHVGVLPLCRSVAHHLSVMAVGAAACLSPVLWGVGRHASSSTSFFLYVPR